MSTVEEEQMRKMEEKLIAEAVASGRVRKFPRGATTNWDDQPFRIRRTAAVNNAKYRIALSKLLGRNR